MGCVGQPSQLIFADTPTLLHSLLGCCLVFHEFLMTKIMLFCSRSCLAAIWHCLLSDLSSLQFVLPSPLSLSLHVVLAALQDIICFSQPHGLLWQTTQGCLLFLHLEPLPHSRSLSSVPQKPQPEARLRNVCNPSTKDCCDFKANLG